MAITASLVKELRDKTGAGMMDCKKALTETEGDIEKAIDYLRQKGITKAAKKSGRVAAEGRIGTYVHGDGKIGVMVEINSETDFVAKNDTFKEFVRDVAMHIAATNPQYLSRDECPAADIDRERKVLRTAALDSGKPEKIVDKIVDGQLNKFFKENCLLEMPFVKDTDKTIEEVLKEKIALIGENLTIRRYVRFGLGEGIEKKKEDFAAEVAAQL